MLFDVVQRLITSRTFSTSTASLAAQHYKLLVVGGGAGGSGISNLFAGRLGKENVAVVEPQTTHYYQPMFTLVGGGIKTLEQCTKPADKVLTKATWIKDTVTGFCPDENSITVGSGNSITYDYLVVALGLVLRYDLVKGLAEGLRDRPEVCSNYDPKYVNKTIQALKNFEGGTALFTLNMPIKCPGAPQKIMYLADDYLRKHKKREKTTLRYFTTLNQMLLSKKYSDVLYELCQRRGMEINYQHKLVELQSNDRKAKFEVLANFKPTGQFKTIDYDFIHVGPPCSTPEALHTCKLLVDHNGFLNVSKDTLQHIKYSNIFGIGDCTNLPNAKTAAAIASEIGVVRKNLQNVMDNKTPTAVYNGYSSCPVPTSYNKAVLAEFDYKGEPMETLPFDQGRELRLAYWMKADVFPALYWHGLTQGRWEGPSFIRKLLRLGFS